MIFLNKHSEFHGISLGKLGILGNSQGKSEIPGMRICVSGICHLWVKVIREVPEALDGAKVGNFFVDFFILKVFL